MVCSFSYTNLHIKRLQDKKKTIYSDFPNSSNATNNGLLTLHPLYPLFYDDTNIGSMQVR